MRLTQILYLALVTVGLLALIRHNSGPRTQPTTASRERPPWQQVMLDGFIQVSETFIRDANTANGRPLPPGLAVFTEGAPAIATFTEAIRSDIFGNFDYRPSAKAFTENFHVGLGYVRRYNPEKKSWADETSRALAKFEKLAGI